MGRYYNDAQKRYEQIKDYHANAGSLGYRQATHYFDELRSSSRKAYNANNNTEYLQITELIEMARPLMDEMKEWEDEAKG